MFQKLVILTGLLMALVASVPLHAALSDDPMRPDIVGWGADRDTAPIVGVDNDGDILPGRNLQNNIGESTRAWKTGHFGNVDVASGVANFHEFFFHLSSGDQYGLRGGVGNGVNAGNYNAFVVSTITLVTSATTYYDNDIIQSSGAPRNITIWASSSTPGTVTTMTLTGCATFYGTDAKGYTVTELICFSTSPVRRSTEAGAGLCASLSCGSPANAVGMGVGNVAFAYVSSFTAQIYPAVPVVGEYGTNVSLIIGWGQKIGLANNVVQSGDVYKFMVSRATAGAENQLAGGDYTNPTRNPDLSINATYDTFVAPAALLPNSFRNYDVWYRMRRMWP